MRPKASSAVLTTLFADSQSATLSVFATAVPPLALISSTTFCAGPSRAFTLDRGPDIVHDHAGAGGRHREREIAADTAARAGDDDALAFERLQSRKPGYFLSARRKSAGHSSGPQRLRVSGR